MQLLTNIQDVSRIIDDKVKNFLQRSREILENEVEAVRADIAAEFKGSSDNFGSLLQIEFEGKLIRLILPYRAGDTITARKKHNPLWKQFKYQPFQDVLEKRGYTNVSPGKGIPIEPSKGSAPNVIVTAELPDILLREIVNSI